MADLNDLWEKAVRDNNNSLGADERPVLAPDETTGDAPTSNGASVTDLWTGGLTDQNTVSLDEDMAADNTALNNGVALQNVTAFEALDGPELEMAKKAQALIGIDLITAKRRPNETRTQIYLKEMQEFLKSYPRLSGFLADPTNNAIARSDLMALGRVVKALENIRKSEQSQDFTGQFDGYWDELKLRGSAMVRSGQSTLLHWERDGLPWWMTAGNFAGSAMELRKQFVKQTLGYQNAEKNLTDERKSSIALLDNTMEVNSEEYKKAKLKIIDAQWQEDHGYTARLEALAEERKAEEIATQLLRTRVDPDSFGRYLRDGSQAIIQMAPSILATVITKNPALGASLMGVQVYGQRYDQAYARTGNHTVAQNEGILFAAVELVTERIPLKSILPKKVVGTGKGGRKTTKFLADVLKTSGMEAGQEILVEAFDIGYGIGILSEDMTMSDATRRLFDAGVIGFGVGGAMQITGKGASAGLGLFYKNRQDIDAIVHADNLTEAQIKVEETKTHAASPEVIREFIESEAQDDGTVLVNAEKLLELNQEDLGADPDNEKRTTRTLGVDQNELVEAAKRGGDIAIKKADLLTMEKASFDAIAPYIRKTVDAPTALEAQAALDQRDKDVAELVAAMDEEVTANPSAQPVYDAVYNNLINTGRTVEEADAQGQLYQERYNARAENLDGVTAHELFLEENVSIRGGMISVKRTPNAEQRNAIDNALQQTDIPAQTGSQSTQRPNTAGSYPKILKRVEAKVGKVIGRVLDYGAGLGLGSDAMRRAGYKVDSFEPQPSNWKGITQPTFIDNKGIKGQYDTIMLMNVLNVLEPELRDVVLDDVIDKIAEGGQAVIGARKFKNDIENTKSGTETNEAKAFKLENGAYQKGWDGNELLEYVQSRLPEGYSAVKINAGATGVLIRHNVPTEAQNVGVELNQEMPPPNDTVEDVIARVEGQYGPVEINQIDGVGDNKDIPIITLKDLIGFVLMPTVADRTAIAATFKGTMATRLRMAIPLLGGPYFPLRLSNRFKKIVWGDRGKAIVGKKQDAIDNKGATHKIVFLGSPNMHVSNTTVNQSYFQVLFERVMMQQVSRKQLKDFAKYFQTLKFAGKDKKTKQVIDQLNTFVGFDSFYDGTNGKAVFEWLQSVSFETRKQMMLRVDNATLTGLTGINLQEILNATREPSLNVQSAGTGVLIVKIDKENSQEDIDHPDFPLGMKGEVVGVLRDPVSYKIFYKQWREQQVYDKVNPIDPVTGERDMGAGREPTDANVWRAFEMSLPVVEVTQEMVDEAGDLSSPNIDGQIQAQAILSMISANKERMRWGTGNISYSMNDAAGGVSPVEYEQAAKIAKSSLVVQAGQMSDTKVSHKPKKFNKDGKELFKTVKNTGFNAKLKMGLRGEVGGYLLTKLQPAHAYTLIEITPKGNKIVSIINNESGTEGFAYDALILDALDRGATYVEVAEGTAEYDAFIDIGFEPANDGTLVWKGEKTENESYSTRYIQGGYQNIFNGRADPDAETAVEQVDGTDTQQLESRARARLASIGSLETEVYDKTLSSSARQIAVSISQLSDESLDNLDLTIEDRASVANIISNPLPLYQEEAAKVGTADLLAELEIISLPTDETVLGVLGGFPNYLESVADFINNQRQKLTSGTLTVRDLIKAHAITVGSQGAGAMKVETFTAKTGFVPSSVFVDRGMIRPEEAVAMWFGTAKGQEALDAIEEGNTDPELWTELLEWRKAWGDNRLKNMGFIKSLSDIADVTNNVNELGKMAGRGQNVLEDINAEVRKLGGIGPAKTAFITHLLGLGDVVTMDAVEINFWLTGKADVKALKGKQKALVNATKGNEQGMSLLRDMVMARFQNLKDGKKIILPDNVSEGVFMHVMHHWLWDRAKGLETTHAGLYEAMTMYQDGQQVDVLPEAKLEKRHPKYGVGKRMGPDVYIHKSSLNVLPANVRETVKNAKLPDGYDWQIIKYNEKTGQISLIESPDWDAVSEPTTGDSFIIKPDGTTKIHKAPADPAKRMIYHHKWLFVKDNYTGFDVAASRMRSRIWKALPNVDVRRIGKREYWESQVVPRLTPNKLAQKDTSPVGPRGSFHQERNTYGDIANIITLTENANKSTFLHESGHFFMFQMVKDLKDPRLTAEGKATLEKDMATTRNWFRKNANEAWAEIQTLAQNARKNANKDPENFAKKERAQRLETAVAHAKKNGGAKYMRQVADTFMSGKLPYATDLEISYHELWARGAEQYFGSGVAPTYALRSAYLRFAEWMVGVYQNLKNLKVNIDPEIARVFDRLVTSSEAVKNSLETDALAIPADLKEIASEAEFEALVKLAKTAQADARTEVHTKVLALLKREQNKQRKEEEAKIKEDVTAEVRAQPIYAAINMMRKALMPTGETITLENGDVAPMQINREAFIETYGVKAARAIPSGILTKKGAKDKDGNPLGTDINIVAKTAGFEDADTMVAALQDDVTPEKAVIDNLTAERIKTNLPVILSEDIINEKAIEAVANDKQLDVLAAQARILRRLIKQPIADIAQEKVLENGAPAASNDRLAMDEARDRAEGITPENALEPESAAAQIEVINARETQRANVQGRKAQRAAKRKISEILRNVSMDVIKETARVHIQSLTLNAINPNKYRATADRLGKQYAKAIAARDYQLAEDLLNQISLNIALSKEASMVKDKLVKKIGQLQTIINKSDKKLANSYDTDIINLMRGVLFNLQIGNPRSNNATVENALSRYEDVDPAVYNELQALLTQANGIAQTIDDGKGKVYQRVPIDNLTEVINLMNRLLQEARDVVRYNNKGEIIHRDQIIAEFKSSATDITIKGKPKNDRGSKRWRRRSKALREFGASLVRVELWARWFDNNRFDGPMNKYIVEPVMEAVTAYKTARTKPIQRLAELLKGRGRELYERVNIACPEFDGWVLRTKGELIHMLLHTGNASNLRKMLLSGQKDPVTGNQYVFATEDPVTGEIDTSKFDAFMGRMFREGYITQADIELVNGVWEIFDETKEAAQKAHKEMHGYYFTELPATPYSTPLGNLTGGYVPAIYDMEMNNDVAKHMTEDTLATQSSTGMFPTPDAGFTKGRVEYNQPMALDLTMLPLHLDKVIRFAYIAPSVRKVGRLLLNKQIQEVLGSVDKSIVNSALLPWLQRTVTQQVSQPSDNPADGFFRYLSRASGAQTMAGNIINTAQQFTGIITAATLINPIHLAKALFQWRKNGLSASKYIWSKSPFMHTRMQESQNDFANQVGELLDGSENVVFDKLIKTQNWANKHAYFLQQMAQNMIDPVVWLAAEQQARGKGHVYEQTWNTYIGQGVEIAEEMAEKAVSQYADRVVRDTQSPMEAQDISRIEAGSAGARLFIKFYSYFNNMYNLNKTEYKLAARQIGWSGKPTKYLYIYLMGIAAPAIIAQGVAMAARGDFDNDDKEAEQLLLDLFLWSQVDFVSGMIPYAGAGIRWMKGNYFTKEFYDDKLSISPAIGIVEGTIGNVMRTSKEVIEDPESTEDILLQGKNIKRLLDAVGIIFRVPTKWAAKPIAYWRDVEEEYSNPRDIKDIISGVITGRDATTQ